jgi:membrane protease YdiL (CAAX protease family)
MILSRLIGGMGVVLFWVVLAAFALVAEYPTLDAILLTILLVAVPTFSLAQVPMIRGVTIERLPAYRSSIITLWLIGTACWFVGTRDGGAAALGFVPIALPALIGWTGGVTVAALLVMLVFRQVAIVTERPDSDLLHDLLPRSQDEKRLFVLLSVAAGSGEELAYRGYAIPVLAPLVGVPGAAILTTAIFAVMHGYQGILGVLRTGVMGGLLAWAFLASGSLWPSIIAHTLIDLLAGLVLGDRLLVSVKETT